VDAFASSIEVVADERLPIAAAEVTDTADPSLTLRIDDPLGEDTRPLDADHVKRKFRDLATPVFGADRVKEIVARAAALETEADVSTFIHLLRRNAKP